MIYFLLLIYILAFGLWIKTSPKFAIKGLTRPFIAFIFVSKIIVGLVYGAIHLSYFKGGDTFLYLQESTLIGDTFFSYPQYYIYSILGWDVPIPNNQVFTYPESSLFWKDLGSYMLVHAHAVLHAVTFGYYELHIFFIAIVGLFASLNFYKIFDQILDSPKPVLITCCFFLPSLTFWTAGLHKDVYVYFGLSLFLSALLSFQDNIKSKKAIFKLISAIIIIGLARHYLLALLIPATIAYLITLHNSKRVWGTYLIVYTAFIAVTLFFTKFVLNIEIFELLVNKQAAFLAEAGDSSIKNIESFTPNVWGVIGMAPMAAINVLGRPFLWECKDFLQVLASIEILCFIALAFFAFLVRKQSVNTPNILIYFMVAYAISNLLVVGLLVSNIGTIVRYRAIPLSVLSALLTHLLDVYSLSFQKIKVQKKQRQDTLINSNKNQASSSSKKNSRVQ